VTKLKRSAIVDIGEDNELALARDSPTVFDRFPSGGRFQPPGLHGGFGVGAGDCSCIGEVARWAREVDGGRLVEGPAHITIGSAAKQNVGMGKVFWIIKSIPGWVWSLDCGGFTRPTRTSSNNFCP